MSSPSPPPIDLVTILASPKLPPPTVLLQTRITPPQAIQLLRSGALNEECQLKHEQISDLMKHSLEELDLLFSEWGIPVDGLTEKEDYIQRYFDYMVTLAPWGTPSQEITALSPPLSPNFTSMSDLLHSCPLPDKPPPSEKPPPSKKPKLPPPPSRFPRVPPSSPPRQP